MKNQPESFQINSLDANQDFNLETSDDQPTRQVSPLYHDDTMIRNQEVQRPVAQEMQRVESLTQNNQEVDDYFRAEMKREWTGWEKLTERSLYRQVQKVKHELLEASAHYRLGFYKTMLDARLEALNEKCDAGLKMMKAHFRLQVSTFLMAKMEELTLEVKDRQIKFLEMMKEKYAYSDTLTSYPSMQKRYLNSMFEEEARYLKFLDSLILRFESIVDEQLKKYN